MNKLLLRKQVNTGVRVFLLITLLLLSFGPLGMGTVRADHSNDHFATPTIVIESEISFSDSLDVSTYSTETGEVPPPGPGCGNDIRSLGLGYKTAWYKFTPLTAQLVSFDTIGTDYDTYIAVWKGSTINDLVLVGCDDDTYDVFQSQVAVNFTQADVDNETDFYIQVAKYSCSYSAPASSCTPPTDDPDPTHNSLEFHANFYNINVSIGTGSSEFEYTDNVPDGEIRTQSFSGLNTGPALVTTVLQDQMVASMRVIYRTSGKNRSYSELMGFPAEQATTEYYFPWYTTNTNIKSQLRIVNVGNQPTTVVVRIKGTKKGAYTLNPGQSKLVTYSGVNNGPVWVKSTVPGVNIITSMRVLYKYNGAVTSYSELMGFPANQLTHEYYFPQYKTGAGLTSQLRIANVGGQPATVKVCFGSVLPNCAGGTIKKTYNLTATGSGSRAQVPVFSATDMGPVRVYSIDPSDQIIVSMKQTYKVSGIPQSYSEMMGYPANQLTTEYQFPWYNNNGTTFLSSLRIVNADDTDATDVYVYIGGNAQTPINLVAGEDTFVNYPLDDGPVRVVSTNPDANILVSLQVRLKLNGKNVSYSEFTGIPFFGTSVNTAYLFPWYLNNSTTKSELSFGYP